MQTVIVDSGGANLCSLQFALQRLGASSCVSGDPNTILAAERVVLPGVGAAAAAMRRLIAAGLPPVLHSLTQPVLGICLGMQLLFERSEEGATDCLGLLPQGVRCLPRAQERAVPHMGWNTLLELQPDPLLEGVAEGEYVYFAHSYAAAVTEVTLASVRYGTLWSAIVRRANFWGTQFHPERSGATGTRILENFLRL